MSGGPLPARWPGQIPAGRRCSGVTCPPAPRGQPAPSPDASVSQRDAIPLSVEKLRSPMTDSTVRTASHRTRAVIPISCVPYRGARGFATLLVDQRGAEIVLDVQVTGGCMIILDEAGAAGLFGLLAAWLAGISVVPGAEIG